MTNEPIESPKQAQIPELQEQISKKTGQDQQLSIEKLAETHELYDLDAQLDLEVLSKLDFEHIPQETKEDRAR